jgi:hypothetical protein
MYAQAVEEIKSGARTYFDNETEHKIQIDNADFLQIDCMDDIFFEMFHRPSKDEKALRLTATEIVQRMKMKYHNISINNSNIMRVGHIVTRNKFKLTRGKSRRYDVATNDTVVTLD